MEFKVVVCNLGNQLYGIDINNVRGIEKEQEIVTVPNSANYIKGIMNLRGEIIPIYSLREKFGMEEKEDGLTQFVIVRIDDVPLAIEVDNVGEICQTDDDKIYETPKIVVSGETKYIDKVINDNGKLILVINIEELLSESEKSNIENMIDACQNLRILLG